MKIGLSAVRVRFSASLQVDRFLVSWLDRPRNGVSTRR
jgi:hypothetical protein